MLTKDCLLIALENISGKKFSAEQRANCKTICSTLNEFNKLYKCIVNFAGILGSTSVTDTMTVTVKDSKGNTIAAGSDGKYTLTEGSYTYDATCTGAKPKTGVAFEITNNDEQAGTKQIIITFEAAV